MQEFVIIVAGGSGSRMKSDIPKQFLLIKGRPILMHTISAFRSYSENLNVIVVLPHDQFERWHELCVGNSFQERYNLVPGGETRFHSVKNGLESITEEKGLVAVHDGVRPVIAREIIADSFLNASQHGTAVVSVPLKDSLRSVAYDDTNKAEDRTRFRLVQTPQTFRLDWMRQAFSQPYQSEFTDCASVLESAGFTIRLIEGAYENIKITTPEDLRWAETYLRP